METYLYSVYVCNPRYLFQSFHQYTYGFFRLDEEPSSQTKDGNASYSEPKNPTHPKYQENKENGKLVMECHKTVNQY